MEEDIKRVDRNIETNKDKIIELYKEIKTIRRGIRDRKKKNKKYNDLSLRVLELRNDIGYYKNDTLMLKNRLIEFESLKDNILLRKEKIEADVEKMDKNNIKRCVDCNIDIHRASYSRHLKTKGHLEKNQTKSKTTIIKKDKNENIKKNNKIEYKFTDDILNKIYDITVDRRHKKELNSQRTITSKFDDTGIEMYYINEILKKWLIYMLNI